MKGVLKFAVVGEALTGLALLIVPSLIGWLLLGVELAGAAVPAARVAGITLIGLSVACLPGRAVVGMLITARSLCFISATSICRRLCRHSALAGSCFARGVDCASRAKLVQGARGHTNIEPMSRAL